MSVALPESSRATQPEFVFTATYYLGLASAVPFFQKALECNLQAELHAEGSTRARVEVRLDERQWGGLLEALSALQELHEFGIHGLGGRDPSSGSSASLA